MSSESQQPSVSTLREALKFFLEDDNMIDHLEAEALQDLLLQDGKIDPAEKAFLEEAIKNSNFDERALNTLKNLLAVARL